MSPDELVASARDWLAVDPDPDTRAAVDALLTDGDAAALAEYFDGHLAFGTAGLRAALGPGPRRMNRVVVRRTTAGLVDWLPAGATVAIGYDARHGSRDFALDAAGVVAAAGGRAILVDGELPTPLLAFTVRHVGAAAGVMITASHNPPQDNGYKVYLADGAQLPPPIDAEIAARVAAAPLDPPIAAPDDPAIERRRDDLIDAYVAAIEREQSYAPAPAGAGLVIAYTAMHGVGRDLLLRLFAHLGLPEPTQVPAQCDPDPDFPTVTFPNPEEPGALDLALATARAIGADLILANDPDADRLGVAIPDGRGGWLPLTGNEIGALLGDWVLRHTSGDDRLVATTVVSGSLLERLAVAHGARYAQTLTGFKWIVRPGLDDPDARMVFGYEEAIGFALGDAVRDKDGLSAAAAFTRLALEQRADGRSVLDRLTALARTHGLHASTLRAVRYDADPERRSAVMERLRGDLPERVAGRRVVDSEDLLLGRRLPPTDGVVLRLDGQVRVTVRPSGTEPKVKCYLEVVEPLGARDYLTARGEATAMLERLADALVAEL